MSREVFTIHARLTASDEASSVLRQAAQRTAVNFRQLATSMSAAATASFGLFVSFDNLQKVQLRVQQAQASLTAAQATAESAQRRYNEAVEKFGADSEQAREAALRLQAAQQQLEVATGRLHVAQGDLNNALVQFGLMLAPQALTMSTQLRSAFQALGVANARTLIPSLRGASAAFRGLTLAMGPVGLALLAISAAVAAMALAWEQNWFGVREKTRAAVDTLRGLWEGVLLPGLNRVRQGAELLASAWGAAWGGMLSTVHAVSGGIRAAADAILAVIRPVLDALSRLQSLGAAVGGAITGAVAGAAAGAVGAIPGLQAGGLVTRPTLAVLGEREPELVIPLSRARAPLTALQPSNVTLHATFTITPEAVDRLLLGLEHRQTVRLSGMVR